MINKCLSGADFAKCINKIANCKIIWKNYVYDIQYCRMLPIHIYIYLIQSARHVSGLTFIENAKKKNNNNNP